MQISSHVGPNPIVVKELRSRMRGARAFVILTVALLTLAAISYALYRIVLSTASYSYSPLSPKIGQMLFIWLAILELLMVCFLTPAITAGAISSERENLTYEMLLATPLRPASILRGKLTSALSYIFMLIFAAIPLFSLVFIFGGVAPRDLLKVLIILVTVAVTWGMTSVFFSVLLKRTARATVVSYLAVLLMLLGPVFLYILSGILRNAEPPRWILIPNPLSALFSAVSTSTPDDGLVGFSLGVSTILGGNMSRADAIGFPGGIPRPLYHYTLPFYGMLTLVLYLLSVQIVQPARRWRVRWKELLTALVLFLFFIGVVMLGFVTTAHRYERAGLFSRPSPTPVPGPVNLSGPAPVVVERVVVEKEVVAVPMMEPTVPPVVNVPSPIPLLILPDEEQAAIYGMIVRDLFAMSRSLGELPEPQVVYLGPETQDGLVDPLAPRAESRLLPEAVQKAIVDALADLPAKFSWEKFPPDKDGALLTLGNIYTREDGLAVVSANFYASELGAVGQVYTLDRVDGQWQVVGETDDRE